MALDEMKTGQLAAQNEENKMGFILWDHKRLYKNVMTIPLIVVEIYFILGQSAGLIDRLPLPSLEPCLTPIFKLLLFRLVTLTCRLCHQNI